MMKSPIQPILIVAFTLFAQVLCAQSIDLNTVRTEFSSAVKSEEICLKNYDWLSDHADTPIEKGYEAVYRMIIAKHTSNPFKKMNNFKSGKKQLETVIKDNPSNTELRFIRFVIQAYIPKYLGYNEQMDTDKVYLVQNLSKMGDAKTKHIIYKYLKGTNLFTAQDLALMN